MQKFYFLFKLYENSKTRHYFLILQVLAVLFFAPFASKAQQVDLNSFQVSDGWYVINGGLYISPTDFFASYKQYWGMSGQDDIHLVNTEIDTLGRTVYRYQQKFNGYNVEKTDFLLHYKDSLLLEAHGTMLPNITINTSSQISEATALSNALNYLNATEYAWQNSNMQAELREAIGDSSASYYPIGKLLLARQQDRGFSPENMRFAYKFEIITTIPYQYTIVYVDANSGEVFQSLILEQNDRLDARGDVYAKGFTNKCDVTGSCITLYNGYQEITVIRRFLGLTDYILKECDRNIHTTKGGDLWSFWNVTDNDGNWGTDEQWSTSAHWAVERSYDYFKHVHGRKGINGNGRKIRVDAVNQNDFRSNYEYNSYKNEDNIRVGKHWGYPQTPSGLGQPFPTAWNIDVSHASLDHIGRIYTRGVLEATANLSIDNIESGALLASFCDIFGTMIERAAQGGTFNWTIGEATGITERNMQSPISMSHPARFQGDFWASQVNTFNGVLALEDAQERTAKINAGVQNRWFYLLAMGGQQDGVVVSGIGIDKASAITYRNLTTKLGANATFAQAREGAILSAIELYGACSVEVTQVRNAWAAVGVGQPNDFICFSLSGGGGLICKGYLDKTYTVESNQNIVVQWVYPSGLSATISGVNNRTLRLQGQTFHLGNITVKATVGTRSATTITNLKSCVGPRTESMFEPLEAETEVGLYPNPTKSMTTVDLGTEKIENATAEMMNMQGIRIAFWTLPERKNILNLSTLPSGLYFVHITNGEKRTIRKIQITK